MLIIAGGALLLTPGFLTDIFGLALLLPPTRAVVRRVLARRLLHRMVAGMTGPPSWPPPRRSQDVEGTYAERADDQEPPGR